MAQPTDKIDAEILPDPELNPLLNPLLAAHMGRWAEVYFTTPPEKRSQAVYDLIRELKSHSPMESASAPPVIKQSQGQEETEEQQEETEEQKTLSGEPPQQPSPLVVELRRTCSTCSADNSAEQKFCGMCGAPLPSSSPRDDSRFLAVEPTSEENWSETHSSSGPEFSIGGYSAEDAAERPLNFGDYARRDFSRRKWPISEADLPHFAKESESLPYRYRLYVGIAVALVLGVLLYMAWHRTPSSSGDVSESVPSRVIPAAPSRAPPASTPEPSAKRTVLPTDQATARPPVPSAPAGATSTDRSVERQNQAETPSHQDQTPQAARAAEPRIVPVAENSSVTANDQSGEEELATAEKYLNGSTRGVTRDNREAAQWLWKAVGKGNLAATLALSDLYLRGDGVPKNCDQARLLLDAAARKGKASAAERLRNLQAFGCQ